MRTKKSARLLAILVSVLMVFTMMPLTGYAAADPEPEYTFDHTKTAVSQLEELFTTIDIMDATAAGLSEEMEQGNVTSEQLVQMYLDRIKAYDNKKKLHSIISINPNALDDARAMDAEREAGTVRGPLHGIPVIVKDNYDLAGTAGRDGYDCRLIGPVALDIPKGRLCGAETERSRSRCDRKSKPV